jgi:deoxyxylulose-5-phosphate synthase
MPIKYLWRRDEFSTRDVWAASQLSKPCESINDAFIADMPQTLFLFALGMAGKNACHENYDVAAIIGMAHLPVGWHMKDSATRRKRESIVIIINDNGMAINKNVEDCEASFTSAYKAGILLNQAFVPRILKKVPPVYNLLHGIKEKIKKL